MEELQLTGVGGLSLLVRCLWGVAMSLGGLDSAAMGLLTFSLNVTLDGCVDHQEGIADDETHAFFTGLMDAVGAMLWGRVTYELMEGHWPAVARGDVEAVPAMREWADKLEAKPKYVVSSTRKDFPWTNSHHIAGDVGEEVQKLKDATPAGVLLGSGKLATELDRLDLIDEYKMLVQPMIAGHGPTLHQGGLPATRRLELVSAEPFGNGVVAMHYRRAR
jgi:dihydrofolate reductase